MVLFSNLSHFVVRFTVTRDVVRKRFFSLKVLDSVIIVFVSAFSLEEDGNFLSFRISSCYSSSNFVLID